MIIIREGKNTAECFAARDILTYQTARARLQNVLVRTFKLNYVQMSFFETKQKYRKFVTLLALQKIRYSHGASSKTCGVIVNNTVNYSR